MLGVRHELSKDCDVSPKKTRVEGCGRGGVSSLS